MCGIAGAYGVNDAAYIVSLMLKQLQHRGQEAAGIVSSGAEDGRMRQIRGFGLVDEVFRKTDFARDMPGESAVGHVRYSTSAEPDNLKCVQPFLFQCRHGELAVAHNGNLTNYPALRADLERQGAVFQSQSDTGVFPHLFARAGTDAPDEGMVMEALMRTEGASSLLVLTARGLVAAVDSLGFRPLCLAEYGGGIVFASETCAFDLLKAASWRPVEPGSVVMGSSAGLSLRRLTPPYGDRLRRCSFCHVYFSRPDSEVFGVPVAAVRERLGSLLAKRHPLRVDAVIPVPDSSNMVALAYARELGLRFDFGLIRNHYTGRTFITPRQTAREFGVRMKLNAVRHLVAGKSLAVVDDSVVRGTTCRKIAGLLRDAGAREVHFLSASPPVIRACDWGIDTGRDGDLIAAKMPVNDMPAHLGLDSIGYLAVDDLLDALDDPNQKSHCVTCFSGEAPRG